MNHFTPGPWEPSLGQFSFTNDGARSVMAGDRLIASVVSVIDRNRKTPYDAPDGTRDANACLIAAAPDLLQACKDALALLEDPDADAFMADRVSATLASVIERATGGMNDGK